MIVKFTKMADGQVVMDYPAKEETDYGEGYDTYVNYAKQIQAWAAEWETNEVRIYKIADNVTDGLLDHTVEFKAVLPITEKSEGIHAEGHHGTWYVIDKLYFKSKPAFICEHEYYGDEADYIAIDKDGKILAEYLAIDDYRAQLKDIENGEHYDFLVMTMDQFMAGVTEDVDIEAVHVEAMELKDEIDRREQETLADMDAKTEAQVARDRELSDANERKHRALDKVRDLYKMQSKTPEQKLLMSQLAEEWITIYCGDENPEAMRHYIDGKYSAVQYLIEIGMVEDIYNQGETNPWI